MKARQLLLIVVLVLFLQPLARARDVIYVEFLGMHADKSTLTFIWGQNEENVAVKVSLGNAFAGAQVGIVYAERTTMDNTKIDGAKSRLQQLLRSDVSSISLEDVTKRIGLTFLKFVEPDEVRR